MDTKFTELLGAMPSIARAVNEFSAESAQREALQALLSAFLSGAPGSGDGSNGDQSRPPAKKVAKKTAKKAASPADETATTTPRSVRGTGRRAADNGSMDRDLDLHPKGLESFADFCKRAQPKSQNENILVSVYWLLRVAERETVGIDQVFTCFRDRSWPIPNNLANKVSQTGSKGWLRDSRRELITLGTVGLNHVEHDMLKRGAEESAT